MALFLLTFFLIYGSFHIYFYLKVRAAFAPGAATQAILIVLLLLGLIAPILIRICERHGLEMAARFLSWAGYLWMGFLLLFFSISILFDLWRFLTYLAGWALRFDPGALVPPVQSLFLVPAAIALGIVLYGANDARSVGSESLVIHSEKLPKEIGAIRIVQISDVHIGTIIREGYLEDILRKVREAKPDLLISTGDLVDGQGNDLTEAAVQLQEITPRYGKFAITGNHEFYAGLDEALEFTKKAGFTLLQAQVATVHGRLDLAGVDDPEVQRTAGHGYPSDREILARADGSRFTIFLKHRPVVERENIGAFDLQLSGHTHRGQIFPFSLITRLVFPFHAGNYRLAEGVLLHVSRGTGTWGPPVRFLAHPEITIIDLMPG
ncbi:MAG: metallophosphoesterase [Deltaproteobacteria bacterium]|nr:metallophosphoesterase [Deltaproteobacteria bacterium]